MKRVAAILSSIAILLSATSLTVNGASVVYTGTISASTVGANVTTDLPMFNNALGTLNGVQVTLDFIVTPYATLGNFTSVTPLIFTSADSIIFGYTPANIWTISHGSDSWNLAAPTVSTGTILGSGQSVPYYFSSFTLVQLLGSTSASADLTGASGLDFASYTGAGTLVFGTSGAGQVLITDGALFGGGGGNLSGTASVTYDFVPVPEPATLTFLGLGALALMLRKRQQS